MGRPELDAGHQAESRGRPDLVAGHLTSGRARPDRCRFQGILWLLLLILVPRTMAVMDVLAERDEQIIVGGKTYRQKRITIKYDQDDVRDPQPFKDFRVVQVVNGRVEEANVRTVRIRIHPPRKEFTHNKIGYVPVYSVDSSITACLTPFNQNLTSNVQVIEAPELQVQGGSSRRLLWNPFQRMSLTAGTGGIGLGFDLGCLTGLSLFGGCGGGDIDQTVGSVVKQLDAVTDVLKYSAEWMHTAEQRFMNIERFESLTKQELDRQRNSIEIINKEIPRLWAFEKEVATYMTEGFTEFRAQIVASQRALGDITDFMLQLHNSTNRQFVETNQASQALSRMLQDSITTTWQIYQDLPMNRALTKLVWDYADAAFVPEFALPERQVIQPSVYQDKGSYRFLPGKKKQQLRLFFFSPLRWTEDGAGAGRPPNPDGFVGTKNVDSSQLIAWTNVLFSERSGGGLTPYTAYSYSIQYRCDAEFLLNHNVPTMTLKTLLTRIGPKGCNPRDSRQPWTCQCVVVWQKTYRHDLSRAFPWEFDDVRLDLSKYPMNPGPSKDPAVILTSEEEFTQAMQREFCMRTPVVSANGRAFRITSNEVDLIWNIPPPSGNRADSCDDVFGASPGSNALSLVIYTAWRQTYRVISRTLIPILERQFHGQLPDNLQFTTFPYKRDRDTGGTYRCVEARFLSLAIEKYALYTMTLIQQTGGVEIEVLDALGAHTRAQPSVGQGEFPWLDYPDQMLITNVQVQIEQEAVLPAFITRLGDFPSANAPPETRFIIDNPAELISMAQTAAARAGKLNYVFERSNWPGVTPTSQLNITQWVEKNREHFNPGAGLESAINYRRELSTTGECDRSFVDGANPGEYDLFHWCNIVRYFTCYVEYAQPPQRPYQLFHCVPKRFSALADFVIPAGTLQTAVSSTCPDVNSVRTIAGKTQVILTSAATETTQIYFSVRPTGCPPGSVYPNHQTLDLPSKLPTPVSIDECPGGRLEFNVFTLEYPDSPCYTTWVDVTSMIERTGDIVTPGDLPPLIDKHIEVITDPIAELLARQLAFLSDYNIKLQRIERESRSQAEIYSRVRELVYNRAVEVEKMTHPKNWTERIQQMDREIEQDTRTIANNIQEGKSASLEQAKILAEFGQQNLEGQRKLALMDNATALVIRLNEETKARWKEYLDTRQDIGSCADSIGKIPLLGPFTCGIGSFFSDLFGGSSTLMKIITWVVIIGICCCCLAGAVFVAMKIDAARRIQGSAGDSAGMLLNSFLSRPLVAAPPLPVWDMEFIRCYIEQAKARNLSCDPTAEKNVQTYLNSKSLAKRSGASGKLFYKRRNSEGNVNFQVEQVPLFPRTEEDRKAMRELERLRNGGEDAV